MDERIAIVGMEAIFGSDEGLDAFDRTVFDGLRQLPEESAPRKKRTRAGTRPESKEDYPRLLSGSAEPTGESLLRLALGGARAESPSCAGEDAWGHLALILVAGEDLPLEGIRPRVLSRFDSCLPALAAARDLLADPNLRGVVIASVEWEETTCVSAPPGEEGKGGSPRDSGARPGGSRLPPGNGACAVLLRRHLEAKEEGERVYALLEAYAAGPGQEAGGNPPGPDEVARVCREAFRRNGVDPAAIGYLEVAGEGPEDSGPEIIEGLARVYTTGEEALTCAVGSAGANLPRPSRAPGLASLVKTALCVYHRYLPAMPGWVGSRYPQAWHTSPFYVPGESRPWFVDPSVTKRVAAIQVREPSGVGHLIVTEEPGEGMRQNRYRKVVSPYCFPLAADRPEDLVRHLSVLGRVVAASGDLMKTAGENLEAFEACRESPFAVMVLGHTKEELRKEFDFMADRIPGATETGTDLKTPKGSYFTPKPLGGHDGVAFVYPGVGSAYVGLGHATFHLFPEVYEPLFRISPNLGESFREEDLYPRSREPLTEDDIWKRELKLRKDIQSIGEGGMGFFVLYTMILRDVFRVAPRFALGYSLGEPGMIASLGVWDAPGRLAEKFRRSPVFRDRLHGGLTAVREHWGLGPDGSGPPEKIWESYTLQAPPEAVRSAIREGDRAYLTIINAPNEVVIAGEPESCMGVVKRIGCKYFPLGLPLAIHCDPARREYEGLVDLYTMPTVKVPGIKFYSSSCYKPIPIRSKAVAHSIAKAFSEPVDFPRLVREAYEEGARIFIEIGSRKFCSHLIDRILGETEHLAVAVNVKGTRDESSLARVLAQLVAHRVPVDLAPLI